MRTYPHVDPLLAVAAEDIARKLNPQGWDEVPGELEPNTYEGVKEYFARHGKLGVTRREEFGSGEKRLWGTPDPWVAFFVWHDWNHLTVPGGTFGPAGERIVHANQVAQLREWARSLPVQPTREALARSEAVLAAHNIARLEHWRAHGDAPDNLREFAFGCLAALGMTDEVPIFPDHQIPWDARDWAARLNRRLIVPTLGSGPHFNPSLAVKA